MPHPVSTLVDAERPRTARLRWSARAILVAGRPVTVDPVVLEGPVVGLGREPSSTVSLDDPRVSRAHARIHIDEGGARIERIGRAALHVDGVERDEAPLADGSTIVCGASALVVRHGAAPGPRTPGFGLVGRSPAMQLVRQVIQVVGPTPAAVLIGGESGTGKEVVARALHEASRRRGPLVPLNTSAIPASLAESHLFGHVAGAFTGATAAVPGVFRAADEGTLFLDEIADLPIELQPKLLRVLEDRAVIPVGTTKSTPVDVRVVAATHQDLLAAVDAGRFRGDLYARLSGFTLRLPPLRERREDTFELLALELGTSAPPFSPALVLELMRRPWRFNVRELRTVGTQLRVRGADADLLDVDMLDTAPSAPASAPATPAAIAATPAPPEVESPARERGVPTRDELVAMLRLHRGVVENVAKQTGRSRRQVHRWMTQHGLDVAAFREKP